MGDTGRPLASLVLSNLLEARQIVYIVQAAEDHLRRCSLTHQVIAGPLPRICL